MYTKIINEIRGLGHGGFAKAVFSESKTDIARAAIKPVLLKGQNMWQCERVINNQAFHENVPDAGLTEYLEALLTEGEFRQINIITAGSTISFRVSGKKEVSRTETPSKTKKKIDLGHDREKSYVFKDGAPIPPLVDLGVFDRDFHIIKSKHDKYRQINKFIEIIADGFKDYKKKEISVIDFGCGKSYLTFLVYYYFKFIKELEVKITGYDLKSEIVENCNSIARKYGYENLEFVVGDFTRAAPADCGADMIITLHACDTATDHAIYYAIKNKIRHIFCVPCCQHEINSQISCGDEYSILLSHGLYKERFSAILTDCIRCEALSNAGYDVDVIEFVDFSNTPKNAMIRAEYTGKLKPADENIKKVISKFNISHTLLNLIEEKRCI